MEYNPILMFAASSVDSDMLYATKLWFPDPMLYIKYDGVSHLFCKGLEYDRALRDAKVDRVVLLEDALGEVPDWMRNFVLQNGIPSEIAVAANVLAGAKEAYVPPSFLYVYGKFLETWGLRLFVRNVFDRTVKTEDEISAIREAQACAEKSLARVVSFLANCTVLNGVICDKRGSVITSERIKRMIRAETLKYECFAEKPIVACGEQGAQPHNEGNGPLYAGQPIVIDIFPRSLKTYYWADMTRTFIKGSSSEEWQKIYDVVSHAQELGIALVRSGVRASAIDNAIRSFFSRHGYDTKQTAYGNEGFIHGTGHGVGLALHEGPSISSKSNDILMDGQVITIEPGLYFSGKGGVRLEDMVVVRKDGVENLTKFPKTLFIP